jgi:thiol-disulfide isomerase/thioredoxin
MKCIHFRVIIALMLSASNISLAQYRNIVIELEMDRPANINYKLKVMPLPEVEYGIEYQEHTFSNEKGVWKCTITAEERLAISATGSVLPFSIPSTLPLEPGDSVRIKIKDAGLVFTGSASAKFEMLYKISLMTAKSRAQQLNYKKNKYKVYAVNEYIEYRNALESLWQDRLSLLEAYRDNISRFAFLSLKGYFLNDYRYYLGCKFTMLSAKRTELGVNEQDLVQIFDSTFTQLAFRKEEESDTASILPVEVGLRKYAEVAYGRTVGFVKVIDRENVVKHRVNSYYHAKTIYSGLAQRKALLRILMGRIIHKVTDKSEAEVVKDFLDLTNNTPFAEYVKAFLVKDETLKKGKLAPLFVLKSESGNMLSLDSLKGKVVFLDFWFTGCTGCVQMSASLKEVEKQFKGNPHVVFLSISIDKNRDQWINSIKKAKYTTGSSINLFTGGSGGEHTVIKDYNIRSFPAIFLIDSTGKLVQPVPDPRSDNGRSLVYSIRRLSPSSPVDGPYVLYNKEQITIQSISPGKGGPAVEKQVRPVAEKQSIRLKVPIGDSGNSFTVKLKGDLQTEPSEYPKPSRLLAISDIEGNFSSLTDLLVNNKVIDKNFNWIFGDGHLVLSGDFFDRGDQVTETLWLIYSLEEKAKIHGGRVHFILGNHELMNLSGDIRYVNNKYKVSSTVLHEGYSDRLYGANSELGRWLRTKNIVEKIGDLLFTHAGISPELNKLQLSLREINTLARPYYAISSGAVKTEPAATIMSTKTSPFWYRGYYQEDGVLENQIDSILSLYKAGKIVTGHTIIGDGSNITSHFNGKVINTDTHHAAGFSAALLFENDQFYQVDFAGRRRPLLDKDESSDSNEAALP